MNEDTLIREIFDDIQKLLLKHQHRISEEQFEISDETVYAAIIGSMLHSIEYRFTCQKCVQILIAANLVSAKIKELNT